MVLRETRKTVIADTIKLLQLFYCYKTKRVIDVLRKGDYNDHKRIACKIKFEVPTDDERVKEAIAESPMPQLEQFYFELKLSPYEFYLCGEISGLTDEKHSHTIKYFQHRLNHPEQVGDFAEFIQYVHLAIRTYQVRKLVEINAPLPVECKPQNFQEFLQRGHELEVFGKELPLNSFADYVAFKAKTMAKRERNELLDFRIIFREKFQDLIHESEECSELEFNIINGNPFALLEIGCNWSDFPPRQYQTAAEVFTYIRSVTERFYGLKKQSAKTST